MFRVLLVTVAALALPALATADVPVSVPTDLLGGRVPPATTVGIEPNDVDADGVGLYDPEFWDEVSPVSLIGLPAPPDIVVDCDEDARPGSCGIWGEEAADLEPSLASAATENEPLPESTVAISRRLRPAFATWMTGQTPRLRWTAEPGATRYNVQVYLGPRRVASVWTTRTSIRIPPKVLNQGRYYMWVVMPGTGPANNATYGEPLGRSLFGIVLRPRIVFTATRTGVVGEVRPHIPSGSIRLSGLPGGSDRTVVLDEGSRFRLALTRPRAERLSARLVDQGPRPPRGLAPRRTP